MPTPLLLSVDELRERLGFGDSAVINTAVETALRQSTITLEGLLRERFARVDATDLFFIDRSIEHTGGASDFRRNIERRVIEGGRVPTATLNLSRGSVVSITSAFAAFTQKGVGIATDRVDLQTILDTNTALMLNAETGLLRIVDYALASQYVEIQYLAGLLNDGGCPELYLSVPDWLVEMASIQASILINANPNVRREALPADELSSLKELRAMIVADHARYAPMSYKPRDIDTVTSLV